MRSIFFRKASLAVVMAASVAFTAWLYAPGLRGPFIFDDFANLPALGAQGPITSASSLLRFLTAGKADPTGRPLAMASFLIDARDWPADPYPFKRDNLLLHLLNGALLAALLLRVGKTQGLEDNRARFAAGLGAAIWLLHPLFVSTVLYVVQREAMLPVTFTILALLSWLNGRAAVVRAGKHPWLTWCGVYACTTAAVLCKANGMLIPLLILSIEVTLPAATSNAMRARRLAIRWFGPAAALVVLALTWITLENLRRGPLPLRGWSVNQRLLTEPSILLDYLSRLTLVAPPASSLFHDSYSAAQGPFSPWYVVPAMAVCSALVICAFFARHRHRAVAAAILFYFAAHALESSSVPLELYYEHRNYLPALLLFWAFGVELYRLRRPARITIASTALVIAAAMARSNIAVWSDALTQALTWAALEPDSPRAQAYAAQIQAASGQVTAATRRIDSAALRFPLEPQVTLARISVHCAATGTDAAILTGASTALRNAPRDPGGLVSNWLNGAIATAAEKSCPGLTLDDVSALIDAAVANPAMAALPGRRQDLAHARGLIALAQGREGEALQRFDEALAEQPSATIALSQAAALGGANHASLGLRHLEYFKRLPLARPPSPSTGMPWLHAVVLEKQGYWQHELDHLQSELERNAKGNP